MRKRRYFQAGFFVGFFVLWIGLLVFYSPEQIVEFFGDEYGYLVMFIIASLGGVSTFTAGSYYASLFTFAAGGLNFFWLGVVTGCGLTVGDSLFFLLGRKGESFVSQKVKLRAERLGAWIERKPDWVVPVVVLVYVGMTPLPNDILTVSVGFLRIRYRRVFLPILIGNIFVSILFAFLVSRGWEFF